MQQSSMNQILSDIPKVFLTVAEAADMLNVSEKTVRRWLSRGILTSCNATRKILIPLKQIQDFAKATCPQQVVCLG